MLRNDFCGLDFGTSNSTIGIFNGQTTMVPLDGDKPIIRSALFFDYETGECLFGQRGVNEYLSGAHGRLMMSLKSILGSSLMQEKTLINGKWIPYTDILGCLIRYIKQQAETLVGHELSQVVLGRPVHFHDHDTQKDRLAQDTLEMVVRQEGFKTVLFQYEPIAAALAYEQTITTEQLALIVDLGGGTSDFSIIRLQPGITESNRKHDVLANRGIHIGGTDFDTRFNLKVVMPELGLGGLMKGVSNDLQIPSSYYHDLTTWHTLNSLYTHPTLRAVNSIRNMAFAKKPIDRLLKVLEDQQGHRILEQVEQSKCLLSQIDQTSLDLTFIEDNFLLNTHRNIFEACVQDKIDQLVQTMLQTIKDAGVAPKAIDSVFFTGGSTQIPLIRHRVNQCFPTATIVQGDVFSSVGRGLIIDAERRFSS